MSGTSPRCHIPRVLSFPDDQREKYFGRPEPSGRACAIASVSRQESPRRALLSATGAWPTPRPTSASTSWSKMFEALSFSTRQRLTTNGAFAHALFNRTRAVFCRLRFLRSGQPSSLAVERLLDMSGFWPENVGLHVGFLEPPDMNRPCRINSLSAKCRKCRVFIGVESPRGFGPVLRVC